jgi:hypothetical protein
MRIEATVKQRKFAAEIAAGRSKRQAYTIAHPEQKMSLPRLRAAATRASKSPAVQAEIRRLLADPIILDTSPKADDPRALREHAVASMIRLTKHSDGVIAAHAAEWLIAFADSLEAARARKPKTDAEQVISELRELYAKALNEPPLVEAVTEGPGDEQAGEAPAENLLQAAVAP